MKTFQFVSILFMMAFFLAPPLSVNAQEEVSYQMFRERRQKLMDQLTGNDLVVMRSAPVKNRNGSVNYAYRQRSSFYYLTGFTEPRAAFILQPQHEYKFIMFLPSQGMLTNAYTGRKPGIQEAMDIYGADTAYAIGEFDHILRRRLNSRDVLYMSPDDNPLMEMIHEFGEAGSLNGLNALRNLSKMVDEMRLYKDPEEIRNLRKAADITCQSHIEVLKSVTPGTYEYEAQALIEYVFRRNGASGPGFHSIVASGSNATILHYHENNRQMQKDDLLLMDIGAEYNLYTADVTRTIPVGGAFSEEQKNIYQLVLKAIQEGTKELVPGKGIYMAHHKATDIIINGLHDLGLVTDPKSQWQREFYTLYPISHWLGLDVHDVGYYGKNNIHGNRGDMVNKQLEGRILEPGMVQTIEPGIYLRENAIQNLGLRLKGKVPQREIEAFIEKVKPVYEKYKGIGVRIEDDVLITQEGNEVLSGKAPKTIEAIEDMMSQ